MTWLCFDVDKKNRTVVDKLWCKACRTNEEKILSMKNYSNSWIKGSINHKTSNVIDHAKSDQHKAAMIHVRKVSNQPLKTYSPIARSLLTINETTQKRMEKKFDITYMLMKENMAFTKYPAIYELEVRHGVNLGHAYNKGFCKKLHPLYCRKSTQEFYQVSFNFTIL